MNPHSEERLAIIDYLKSLLLPTPDGEAEEHVLQTVIEQVKHILHYREEL